MTKINFDLTEAIEKAQRQAELDIVAGIRRAGEGIARDLLNSGRYKGYGPEGLAHEIIRKKIEDYVLSDAFSQKLDNTIIRVMDEESEKAVRTLLNSKTRKKLFQATSPIKIERGEEWIIVMDGTPEKIAWDIELGWVPMSADENYDVFSTEEKNKFTLPMGGMWMHRSNAIPNKS